MKALIALFELDRGDDDRLSAIGGAAGGWVGRTVCIRRSKLRWFDSQVGVQGVTQY